MTKQVITRLVSALAVGIALMAAPAISQATTVTSISVTIGTTTFCDTTGVCANKIWNLGGGVDLTTTSALILTQTSGFNFDTSDLSNMGTPVITINGFTFMDTAHILNEPNGFDDLSTSHQEAVDWTAIPTILGNLQVWVGYADTAHGPGPCADSNGTCLPENPWAGSPNVTFLGAPTGPEGCVRAGITSCFDAGAIRIQQANIPEASSVLLLGMGLVGIVLVGRKRSRTLQGRL
ncbi:MAG TPA: PEP-CTERM sorting domain-containing protein [Terriglobia bacterium]|nr:PEP-CTERM sorting domain-containing protein [Terriglobia bacterium]